MTARQRAREVALQKWIATHTQNIGRVLSRHEMAGITRRFMDQWRAQQREVARVRTGC